MAFRVSSVSVFVPAIFAKSFALQQIGCATVWPYWLFISIVIFIFKVPWVVVKVIPKALEGL